MSTTIVSMIIVILGTLLPKFGIEVGSEALTTTVSTILVVGAAIWAWIRRVNQGDVTPLGKRK